MAYNSAATKAKENISIVHRQT